jgi:Secretion system C-terminal sorting domain
MSSTIRQTTILILASAFSLMAHNGLTQAVRVLYNADFETPVLNCNNCYSFTSESQVPGWNVVDNGTTDSDIVDDNVEIWRTNFLGVTAQSGNQHIELNADRESSVFFEVCVLANETLDWSFWHRGRGSSTVPDVMQLEIKDMNTSTVISTSNMSTTNVAWQEYSGTVTNGSSKATIRFTFKPISTGSGDNTVGNFVDNVQITGLKPLVEFMADAYSDTEASGGNIPYLRVNGIVPSASTVTLSVTGGTATIADYTFTSVVNVPAGTYDGTEATYIPINLGIVDDLDFEVDETLVIELVAVSAELTIEDADCDDFIVATSTYTIINDDAFLPITLIAFNASVREGQVWLNWETASELNNDYFSVERSADGKNWHVIATVKGVGTVDKENDYYFTDPQPFHGKTYYRLKQTDFDGTSTYSYIRNVSIREQYFDFKIYPIPAHESFFIETNYMEGFSVKIMDATGQLVAMKIVGPGIYQIEINTLNLKKGLYILWIEGPFLNKSEKIIIQ